jgi:hypothetical protein
MKPKYYKLKDLYVIMKYEIEFNEKDFGIVFFTQVLDKDQTMQIFLN